LRDLRISADQEATGSSERPQSDAPERPRRVATPSRRPCRISCFSAPKSMFASPGRRRATWRQGDRSTPRNSSSRSGTTFAWHSTSTPSLQR
jgi:hypothetical protein